MVVRRRKKITKKRGKLRGTSGEIRRGAGNRGGRGKAGVGKKGTEHKKMLFVYAIGKYGFQRPLKVLEEIKAINVGQLENYLEKFLEEGIAVKKDDGYLIDLEKAGYNKLLGRGEVKHKLFVIVKYFTKKAKEKIESAGGKILTPEETRK